MDKNKIIIDTLKAAIDNPGKFISAKKESSHCNIAAFAVKTDYELESYYVFLEPWFSVFRKGLPENNFSPAGIYVPKNNTIYDVSYAIKSLEDQNVFTIGPTFELLRKQLYAKIAYRIIELYADKTDKEIVKEFGYKVLEKAKSHAHKNYTMSFDFFTKKISTEYKKTTDFADVMEAVISLCNIDELVSAEELLNFEIGSTNLDEKVKTFLTSDCGYSFLAKLFDIKLIVEEYNNIMNDKNHIYHTYVEMSKALQNKETVIVSVTDNYNHYEGRYPVNAFNFNEGYLNSWSLNSFERQKIEDIFGVCHLDLSDVFKISYRGKVIWEAKR